MGEADGEGFMVGPYITARLSDNLYIDARYAVGSWDNTVSPPGSYRDDFETDRELFAGSLIGDFELTVCGVFRPALGLAISPRPRSHTRTDLSCYRKTARRKGVKVNKNMIL